jgi:hypothetical protein
MPRPVEEVGPQHLPDVSQNLRSARRMQPVASIVHSYSGEVKAAGVPSD